MIPAWVKIDVELTTAQESHNRGTHVDGARALPCSDIAYPRLPTRYAAQSSISRRRRSNRSDLA